MKTLKTCFGLIAITLTVICHARTNEEIEDAFAVICDRPEVLFSPAHQKALKVFTDSFPADRLAGLGLPDAAFAWLPESGPCGGPGSPLLIAFVASAARDQVSGRKDHVIYRGWQIVLSHYAYLRKTAPDDFPEIPVLEEMAKKEKSGVLAQEASELEGQKEPIQLLRATEQGKSSGSGESGGER